MDDKLFVISLKSFWTWTAFTSGVRVGPRILLTLLFINLVLEKAAFLFVDFQTTQKIFQAIIVDLLQKLVHLFFLHFHSILLFWIFKIFYLNVEKSILIISLLVADIRNDYIIRLVYFLSSFET